MLPFDAHPDAEQDSELRAVELPQGLLSRLRRAALADDEGLDTALRHVPMPEGLVNRVRRAVLADTILAEGETLVETLDEAIRDVPVPEGLLDRLRATPLADDDDLDVTLRDVPVPATLTGRLRQTVKRRLQWHGLSRWATAVSLALAIGLSYIGGVLGLLLSVFPDRGRLRPPILASSIDDGAGTAPGPALEIGVADWWNTGEGPSNTWSPASAPAVELADFTEPGPALLPWREVVSPAPPPPITISAAHDPLESLGEDAIKRVASPAPRGIAWPLVTGVDITFLIKYGIHPFVPPGIDTQLESSVVPLDIGRASFDLTQRYLDGKDKEWPNRKHIRTEEFLAAMDYEFPAPERRALGLTAAASPSPNRGEGICVLQVGVQAREITDSNRPPAYLVLAVDVSRSMLLEGRLTMVRRALADVIERMGPEDRFALVAFSENARLLLEDCGREDADVLLAGTEMISADGFTNLAEGVRTACAAAPRKTAMGDTDVRVVLLTDGRPGLDQQSSAQIKRRLAAVAKRGVFFDVVDLGRVEPGQVEPGQAEKPNPLLAAFAASGGGKIHRAADADQVRSALLESLTGRPQLVATDARLKVSFNPKAVARYRLLGHEANALIGMLPQKPEAEFLAGQSATALYEIEFVAGSRSSGREIASVELTWLPPGSQQPQQIVRTLRQSQMAPTFSQSPLSLQQAVVAAQTAEVLRESPYAQHRGTTMATVAQLAESVDTRLRERPSFAELVKLIGLAKGEK